MSNMITICLTSSIRQSERSHGQCPRPRGQLGTGTMFAVLHGGRMFTCDGWTEKKKQQKPSEKTSIIHAHKSFQYSMSTLIRMGSVRKTYYAPRRFVTSITVKRNCGANIDLTYILYIKYVHCIIYL